MLAVYKRELRAYYQNLHGYIFAAFLFVMTGIFLTVNSFLGASSDYCGTLYYVSLIFVLIVPIVTMRSVAEEKHQKTDQLLYSLPLTMTKIVLGKFFALCTVFVLPLLLLSIYPLLLASHSTAALNLAPAYSALFGLFLMGAALLSIGFFVSSLTESQVIAAVVSFTIVLLSMFVPILTSLIPETAIASLIGFIILILLAALVVYLLTKDFWIAGIVALALGTVLTFLYTTRQSDFEGLIASVLDWFSVYARFENFVNGMFDLSATVYYLSITGVFAFMTVRSFDKKRWN